MLEEIPAGLARKIMPEPNSGCWLWDAGGNGNGYGRTYWKGKMVYAHRLVYELTIGPIKEGLTIDHLCRNRSCVNPNHLEAVTLRENILRSDSPTARHARLTHCPHGHLYAGKNLYVRPSGDRQCRTCIYRRNAAKRRERAGT